MEELKKQFADFYKKYEQDEHLDMLVFPAFMVKEDPLKYGGYTDIAQYEYVEAIKKYNELAKEDKEKADEFYKDFDAKHKAKYPTEKPKKIRDKLF